MGEASPSEERVIVMAATLTLPPRWRTGQTSPMGSRATGSMNHERTMMRRLARAGDALKAVNALLGLLFVLMSARSAGADELADCLAKDADRRLAGCTRIIESSGDSLNRAMAYGNRGLAYRMKGDNDRAIADYNEAIRLEPSNALAYNNRGAAYARAGDFDRAISDYTEAIRINPMPPVVGTPIVNVYQNRGTAYAQTGDGEHAVADFTDQARAKTGPAVLRARNRLFGYRRHCQSRSRLQAGERARAKPCDDGALAPHRGPAHRRTGPSRAIRIRARQRCVARTPLPPPAGPHDVG
jgi:tetratricopeptide (TPR) repeat protein